MPQTNFETGETQTVPSSKVIEKSCIRTIVLETHERQTPFQTEWRQSISGYDYHTHSFFVT